MPTEQRTLQLGDLVFTDGWARIDIGGVPHEVRALAGTFELRKVGSRLSEKLPLRVLDADITVVVEREIVGEVVG